MAVSPSWAYTSSGFSADSSQFIRHATFFPREKLKDDEGIRLFHSHRRTCLSFDRTAFTQITDTPAKTPVPVAHFYIQTKAGVMAFATAANGTLTPVPGSPFKVSGQMEDIRGRY